MTHDRFGAPSPMNLPTRHDASTRPAVEVPLTADPEVASRAGQHGTGARLVVQRGPGAGTALALTAPVTTIGRHQDCDIVIDDHTVSRRHAELRRDGDLFRLADAGSLNGTYLNRRPVDQRELADGDEIWIGKARFTFRANGLRVS